MIKARSALYPLGAAATVAELEADPHALLAALRRDEPVSWLPVLDGWLVTRHDLALEVVRDAETYTVDDERFSTAQVVGPSMLSLDGPEHTLNRAPFSRPFRLDAVRERFTQFVATEVERLIDVIEPGGGAELRRDFAGPLAVSAMVHALGLEKTDPAEALGWYDAIVTEVTRITQERRRTVVEPGRSPSSELPSSRPSIVILRPLSSPPLRAMPEVCPGTTLCQTLPSCSSAGSRQPTG